jgi:arginyl-tRNA synthetase
LITQQISELIQAGIRKAQKKGDLPNFDIPEIVIERPKEASHGDYATPVALGLARYARMAPVKIAEHIVKWLPNAEFLGKPLLLTPAF